MNAELLKVRFLPTPRNATLGIVAALIAGSAEGLTLSRNGVQLRMSVESSWFPASSTSNVVTVSALK
jgi:hypothetical protein